MKRHALDDSITIIEVEGGNEGNFKGWSHQDHTISYELVVFEDGVYCMKDTMLFLKDLKPEKIRAKLDQRMQEIVLLKPWEPVIESSLTS